jgi:methionyl-tRNA formyltransferase
MDLGKNVVAVLTADDSLKHKIADFVSLDDNVKKTPLYKVVNINDPETMSLVKSFNPDLIIVISWSQIISKEILDGAPLGCVGIHYSLLPERRGGAPLNWAIIDGLKKSGVTLFFYDAGVDTGDLSGKTLIDAETGEEIKSINGTYEVRISDERARLFCFGIKDG